MTDRISQSPDLFDSILSDFGKDADAAPTTKVPRMADDIAPTPTEFEVALRALLEDIEPQQTREAMNNAGAAPKRVSSPVRTLGGQRMAGSRPMTPQEQTMLEEPWVQMGRDAGAFASRGVNAAGFGLPGVALDYAAPNILAGIRENEALANPGVSELGTAAGIAASPVNALIGRAGQAFASLPRWAQGGAAAAPVLATPTEATKDVKPRDYEAPGLGSELMDVAKKIVGMGGAPDAERPLSQDEFRTQRRQMQPKSATDFINDELAATRASPAYQESNSAGKRANMMKEAQANAEKLYAGYQKSVADETARIDREYGDYVTGWKQQRQEHIDKPFAERHPTAANVMTWGGPFASAVGTRFGLKAINEKGAEIARAGATARQADNMTGLADAIVKADKYAPRAALGRAAVVGEAAALPVELRAGADYVDKKTLPPDSKAQQAAENKLTLANIPNYLGGMALDFGSGLIGAGTGGLYNKIRGPSPGVDLAALRQHAVGIPNRNQLSQDQLSVHLMDRARERITAENALAATNRPIPLQAAPAQPQLPPPPLPGGQGGPPLPGPAGPQPGPQAGPQNPQPAAGGSARPTYQGHPLPPGVELRSDGYPYDISTGHPLPKKLFRGRP
jgi:hypothetical protein